MGQRVDDLIAKRELYAKARDAYEQYGRQLEALTQKIDGLNSEATNVKTKLDVVQSEKKKLEQTIGAGSVLISARLSQSMKCLSAARKS